MSFGLFEDDEKPVEVIPKTLTMEQLKTMYLHQRQGMPLDIVVRMSERRIRAWYEYWNGNVYVSVGGKDSHALLHLVRTMYPEVPGVFCDTGLEYPEVRELNLRTPNMIVIRPKMSFKQVIEKYGWPVVSKRMAKYISEIRVRTGNNEHTRRLRLTGIRSDGTASPTAKISDKWQYLIDAPFKISHKCCKVMKTQPLNLFAKQHGGLVPFVGSTAQEGRNREYAFIQHGCNAYSLKRPVSNPITFWSAQHVLQYLVRNKVEIAGCYGDIVEDCDGCLRTTGLVRTGCMFCAFGAHLETNPNRFQKMQITHPKQWEYCMFQLGLREVLEFCGIEWENRKKGLIY